MALLSCFNNKRIYRAIHRTPKAVLIVIVMGRLKKLLNFKRTTVKRIGRSNSKSKQKQDPKSLDTGEYSGDLRQNQTTGPSRETAVQPPVRAKRVWFGVDTLAPVWEEDETTGVKSVHNEDEVVFQASLDKLAPDWSRPGPTSLQLPQTSSGSIAKRKTAADTTRTRTRRSRHTTATKPQNSASGPPDSSNGHTITKVTSGTTRYGSVLTKIVVNLKQLTDIVKDPEPEEPEDDLIDPITIPNSLVDTDDSIRLANGVFLTDGTWASGGIISDGNETVAGLDEGTAVDKVTCLNEASACSSGCEEREEELIESTKWPQVIEENLDCLINCDRKQDRCVKESQPRCNKDKCNTLSKPKDREESLGFTSQIPRVFPSRTASAKRPERQADIHSHTGLHGAYIHYKNRASTTQHGLSREISDLLSVQNSCSRIWNPESSRKSVSAGNSTHNDDYKESLVTNSDTGCSSLRGSASMRSGRSYASLASSQGAIRPSEVLPRRSFFSCHDNALKEAGIRMSDYQRTHKGNTKQKHKGGGNKIPLLKLDKERVKEDYDSRSAGDASLSSEAGGTQLDDRIKSKLRGVQKDKGLDPYEKDEYENKSIHVDPQKIIDYLKLVKTNPEEYVSMQKHKDLEVKSKPLSNNLVNVGRIYSQWQDVSLGVESVVMHAAYELGSKSSHPVCVKYDIIEKQKHLLKATSKEAVQNKVLVMGTHDKMQSQLDDSLSEIEKARAEVELWMRGLSTAQLVKAREVALRELGEGDKGIRQWWLSHNNCRYIRINSAKSVLLESEE